MSTTLTSSETQRADARRRSRTEESSMMTTQTNVHGITSIRAIGFPTSATPFVTIDYGDAAELVSLFLTPDQALALADDLAAIVAALRGAGDARRASAARDTR